MPTDTTYNYCPITKELLGSEVADYDPLEGTVIVPGHATLVKPSTPITGKVQVFNESTQKWTQEVDNRGTVYDTSTLEPSEYSLIGVLPSALTKKKPTEFQKWNGTKWIQDITKVKANKILTVTQEYQTLLDGGITYKTFNFQSDAKSIQTLSETLTAVSQGWVLPVSFAWVDTLNTPHPANLAFLKGLSGALATHKSDLFTKLFNAKQAINAASKTKAINSVQL